MLSCVRESLFIFPYMELTGCFVTVLGILYEVHLVHCVGMTDI